MASRRSSLWLAAGLLLSGAVPVQAAAMVPSSDAEQVTSISQFSDVRPTDWAYQALSNLIERYGCVAATPMVPSRVARR